MYSNKLKKKFINLVSKDLLENKNFRIISDETYNFLHHFLIHQTSYFYLYFHIVCFENNYSPDPRIVKFVDRNQGNGIFFV